MEKRWSVRERFPDEFGKRGAGLPPPVLQILWNRGITEPDAIDAFLHPDYERHLHDPFLFGHMRRAVDRLLAAIDRGERIYIFADYDADGVSAGTILSNAIGAYGTVPGIYIPHRETEGYGMSMQAVEFMAKEGAKVVITCDCGISSRAEIAAAAERGMDVIVTDHHMQPAELPDRAFALIHPKLEGETYPWKGLSGGGVAFKLAQGLLATRAPAGIGNLEAFEKRLTELAAISSVADMVPLLGESRTLVSFGLKVLRKTTRVGLRKLYETAGIRPDRIDTGTIAFQIAPRVNAAGRMDHANTAFALLSATDESEAARLSIALNGTNVERQKMTEIIAREAREQTAATGQAEAPLIIVRDDRWAAGLIGLVAGKLVEEFNRPAFVFTRKSDTELVGSGRSIPAMNIIAAMQSMPELLSRFGGHPQAAGMSITPERFDEFRARIREAAAAALKDRDLTPTLSIDAELPLTALSWELQAAIEEFAPFGMGNPTPRFLARGVRVVQASAMGVGGKHLRLSVCEGDGPAQRCVAWRAGGWAERLSPGDRIDVVYELEVNEWNGRRVLQLHVVDLTVA